MDKTSIKHKTDINSNQAVKPNLLENKTSLDKNQKNPIFNSLVAEGGENFFHYIDWLALATDPNLMILSSLHHYYYDFNDLKGVRTLINLKTLNRINHVDSFLNNIFRVLPSKANFVGSFKDNKIHKGAATPLYQSFRFLNRLINILDTKTEKFMSRKNAIRLLEARSFKIIDMTEIDGITYFCSQVDKKSDNQKSE